MLVAKTGVSGNHYPLETSGTRESRPESEQSEKQLLAEALGMLAHDISSSQVLFLLRKMGTVEPHALLDKVLEEMHPDSLETEDWEKLLSFSDKAAALLPERYKTERFCEIACKKKPANILLFPAHIRTSVAQRLVYTDTAICEYLPDEEKTADLFRRLKQQSSAFIALDYAPKKLLHDSPELLDDIPGRTLAHFFEKLPDAIKTREFCLSLAKLDCYNSRIFESLPAQLENSHAFYLEFCRRFGTALKDIPARMINESLHRAAVKNNPDAIAFVQSSLPYYRELCYSAMEQSYHAWIHINPAANFVGKQFYTDVCKEITRDHLLLPYATILGHIPEKFRTEEFCRWLLPRLRLNASVYLQYLPESMRHDPKICLDAVLASSFNLRHVPDCMKSDTLCAHVLANWGHSDLELFPEVFFQSDCFFEYAEKNLQIRPSLLTHLPHNRLTVALCRKVIAGSEEKSIDLAIETYRKLAVLKPCEPLFTSEVISRLYQRHLMRALGSPDLDEASKRLMIRHLTLSIDRPEDDTLDAKVLTTPLNPVGRFSAFSPLLQRLVHVAYSTQAFIPPLFPEGKKLLAYIEQEANRPLRPMPTDEPLLQATAPRPVGGRTLQVSDDGKTFYYKFQRKGESLSDLIGEGLTHTYLQEVKPTLGQLLKSDMPHHPEFFTLPAAQLSQLPHFRDELEITLDKRGHSQIAVYRYQASAEYGIYAHQPDRNICDPTAKPETGILRACHDIGLFTSLGLIPTSTLPAFHNTATKRRWMPLHSILGYSLNCTLPGTLSAWNTTATEYPDFGHSGFRDVFDVELYGKIESYMHAADIHPHCHPNDVNQRLMLANACVENLLAAVLVYARLQQQFPQYHYKNSWALLQAQYFIEAAMTEFIQGYRNACKAMPAVHLQRLLELDDNDYSDWLKRAALELVYWTAAQPDMRSPNQPAFTHVRFDHSDCYALHVSQNGRLATELYGKDAVVEESYPGDFHNTNDKQNLGASNSLFPITSLISGLIRLATKILESNPQDSLPSLPP